MQRAFYQRLANDYAARGLRLTDVAAPVYNPSGRVVESLTQGLNRASINTIKTFSWLSSFLGGIAYESAEAGLRNKEQRHGDAEKRSEDFWEQFGKKG